MCLLSVVCGLEATDFRYDTTTVCCTRLGETNDHSTLAVLLRGTMILLYYA